MKTIGKKLPLAIGLALTLALALGGLYAYGMQYYERNYSWYDGSGNYKLIDAGDLEAFSRIVNGSWVEDEAAVEGNTALPADMRAELEAEQGAAHSFEGETVTLEGDIHYTGKLIYYAYGHTPIGTADHPFQGTFDGGSHPISRLLFTNTDADAPAPTSYVGLFGYVGQHGAIKNVEVKDTCSIRLNVADTNTPVRYVGSVVGYCEGTIQNCTSAADIQVIWDDGKAGAGRPAEMATVIDGVGGIAGYCDGDLTGDSFKGRLEITTPADAYYISKDDAHMVNVVKYVGGIAGRSGGAPERAGVATRTYGAIANCTNSANLNIVTSGAGGRDRFDEIVDSKSQYVGGIAGYAIGDVSKCTNSGGIAATSYVVDFDKTDEENEEGLDQADGGGDAVGGIVGGYRNEGYTTIWPTEADKTRAESNFRDGSIGVDRGIKGSLEGAGPDQIYLKNCTNLGQIEACSNVGGVVGAAGTYTNITACANGDPKKAMADVSYAKVYSTRWNKPMTGGIAGRSLGRISYCRNHGQVANTKIGYYVGGIVGDLYFIRDANNVKYDTPEVWACYNTGICASGLLRRGTIAGGNGGYIHDCLYLYGLTGGDDDEERKQAAVGHEALGDLAVQKNLSVAYASETAAANARESGNADTANAFSMKSAEAVSWLNANAQREGWDHYWMLAANANRGYPVLKEEGFEAVAEMDISALSPSATLVRNAAYTASMNPVPQVKLTITVAGEQRELIQNADFYVMPDPEAVDEDGVCKGITSGKPYTAQVQGIGNYTGASCQIAYGIDKGDFSECSIYVDTKRYTAEAQNPTEIWVVDGSGRFIDSDAYTFVVNAGEDCIDPGAYAVTATAKEGGNYRGSCTGKYTIAKIDIARDCDVVGVTYTEPEKPGQKEESTPRVWFWNDSVSKLYEVNPILEDNKLTYYTIDELKELRNAGLSDPGNKDGNWWGVTDELLESYVGYPKVEGFRVQIWTNDTGIVPYTFATAKEYDKDGNPVYGMSADYIATDIKPKVIGVNYEFGKLDDDWWKAIYGGGTGGSVGAVGDIAADGLRNIEAAVKGSITIAYNQKVGANAFTSNYDVLTFDINRVQLEESGLEVTQTTTVLKYNGGRLPEGTPSVSMRYLGNIVADGNYSFRLDHVVDANGVVREGDAMTYEVGDALFYRIHFGATASIECDDLMLHVTIIENQKPITDESIVVTIDDDWSNVYTFDGISNPTFSVIDTEKGVELREGIDYSVSYNLYSSYATSYFAGANPTYSNSPAMFIRGLDGYTGNRTELYDIQKTELSEDEVERIGRGEVDGVALANRNHYMSLKVEEAGPYFTYRLQGYDREYLSENLGLVWRTAEWANASIGQDSDFLTIGTNNYQEHLFTVERIYNEDGEPIPRAIEPGKYMLEVTGSPTGNCCFTFSQSAKIPLYIVPVQLGGDMFTGFDGRQHKTSLRSSEVMSLNHDNNRSWTLGNTDLCMYTGCPIEPDVLIADGYFLDNMTRLLADAAEGNAEYRNHVLPADDYVVITEGFEATGGPVEPGSYYAVTVKASPISNRIEGEEKIASNEYVRSLNAYKIVAANLSQFEVAQEGEDVAEGAWIVVGEAFYGNDGAKPSVKFYVGGEECAYVEGEDYRLDYMNSLDMKSGTVRITVLDEGHLTAVERDEEARPYVEIPFDIIADKVNLADTGTVTWTLPEKIALSDAEAGTLVSVPAAVTYVSGAGAEVTVPSDAYEIVAGEYDAAADTFSPKAESWHEGDTVYLQVEATGKYEQFYAEGKASSMPLVAAGAVVAASGGATVVGSATVDAGSTFATANQPGEPITVALESDHIPYSATEAIPALTIKDGDALLKEGKDYKLARSTGADAGDASVTVSGMGSYTGACMLEFTVDPLPIESCAAYIEPMTYDDGRKLQPPVASIHVSVGGVELPASDWRVASYADTSTNAGVGAGRLVLEAASGNLTGSATCTFDIVGTPFDVERFKVEIEPKEFTGKNVVLGAADVTVTDTKANGKILVFDEDYTVGYAGGHRDVGEAEALIIGKGNYAGSLRETFKIEGSELSDAEVEVLGGDPKLGGFPYTGTAIKPELKVTLEGEELEEGEDYEVTYIDNVDSGEAAAFVVGKGNTLGEVRTTFEIVPNGIELCTVYQKSVDYAYTGLPVEPAVVLRLNGTRIAPREYELSYFDAAGAKLDGAPVEIGSYTVTAKGTGYNLEGEVTAGFNIVQAPIGECKATFEGAWYDYGAEVKPVVHLATSAGVELSDDEFSVIRYGPGTALNMMSYVILEAESKHLTGTTYKTFTIGRIPISASDVAFDGGGAYTYTGDEIKPSVRIAVGERVLKEGADFNVEYLGDCTSVGTQPVEITCPADSYYISSAVASYEIVEPPDDTGGEVTPAPAPQVKQRLANTMTAKAKTVKAKKGKKVAFKAAKAFTVKNARGSVTYKVAAYDKKAKKKITVSKAGKVTVKKGLKKGTYKLKVNVTASGDANYDASTKTVTLKVKVK